MEILEIILKWVIPLVCGGVTSACITWVKMRKKKESALERGVQCLLRQEIINIHDNWNKFGYCPVHVKESIKRMYAAYSQLNGNDVAKELYHELLEMPIKRPYDG